MTLSDAKKESWVIIEILKIDLLMDVIIVNGQKMKKDLLLKKNLQIKNNQLIKKNLQIYMTCHH